MAQVYVTPESRNSNSGILAIVILFVLMFLGFIAYANDWFSMDPVVISPNPTPNINITTPAATPSSNINITTPSPTPTPAPSSGEPVSMRY